MAADRAHSGAITATEVAKDFRCSKAHFPASIGTSTWPPPPPKKPLTTPAAAPARAYHSVFPCFLSIAFTPAQLYRPAPKLFLDKISAVSKHVPCAARQNPV